MSTRLGAWSLCVILSAVVLLPAAATSVTSATAATPAFSDHIVSVPRPVAPRTANARYDDLGLNGILARDAFDAAYASLTAHGFDASRGTLAIADMRLPSTAQRLVLVDLASRELLLRTWVAHGQGSGGLVAERFSNAHGSHATSLGLYRVGSQIVSPKHGAALLLEGLDAGLNDQARAREVIIHGADYVSEQFIARAGRLGRSWGCPAVPRAEMERVIRALADHGLLYIHGG